MTRRERRRMQAALATAARRPGLRGWRGPGGGEALVVPALDEFRGPANQVCGLYPFSVGASAPMIGAPFGINLITGATVCCDPIAWFQRAGLLLNPSEVVIGLPGRGKSTVARHQALGMHGAGVLPLVLGDLKGEHEALVAVLGGQVIDVGRGRDHLNVLDPGEATDAAARLARAAGEADERGEGARARKLLEARNWVLIDAHARRVSALSALMTILQRTPPSAREEAILDPALRIADARAATRVGVPWAPGANVPVIFDLLQVIREAPPEVRLVALDRGDDARYQAITEQLEATLLALDSGGRLGTIFSRFTTTPQRRDKPVVYKVSSIGDTERDLQAAALVACWSTGFATVDINNVLADAGLEPRRHYFVIVDELWRVLRAGRGMVDRADELTRLNRSYGVGQAYLFHTMSDLLALPTEEDRMKARGFVERAGMIICGGLPASELAMLRDVAKFSRAEEDILTGWSDPPAWDPVAGAEADPPGRGKFLIKVGGRPGIPTQVMLTSVERDLNDTNRLWRDVSRIGTVADLPPVDPGRAALEELAAVQDDTGEDDAAEDDAGEDGVVELPGPPVPPPPVADADEPVRLLRRPLVPAGGQR